jgi:hypothetical protein
VTGGEAAVALRLFEEVVLAVLDPSRDGAATDDDDDDDNDDEDDELPLEETPCCW